jgi:hypothetical protein
MTSPAFEAFLARIYVDADYRARFLASPWEMARLAGLSEEECGALAAIDRTGLEMAAISYSRKREQKLGNRAGRESKPFFKSLPRREP